MIKEIEMIKKKAQQLFNKYVDKNGQSQFAPIFSVNEKNACFVVVSIKQSK